MDFRLLVIISFLAFSSCNKLKEPQNKKDMKEVSTEKSISSKQAYIDSLWFAWNKASCIYIEEELKIKNDSCLSKHHDIFKKGENYRKEFINVLKKMDLIDSINLKNNFHIIEIERLGNIRRIDNYFIEVTDDKLVAYFFRFSNQDVTWVLNKKININKNDFTLFYSKVLNRKDGKDANFNIGTFNISTFKQDTIISYLSYCKYDNVSIDLFNKMIEYY